MSPTNAHSPSYEWRVAPGDEQSIAQALAASRDEARWDLALLHKVPEGSSTLELLKALSAHGGQVETQPWEQSAVLDLSGGWERYLAQRSRKLRYEIRRRVSEFLGTPGAAFIDVSDTAEWRRHLDSAFEVEASGWKGSEGTAIKLNPTQLEFYRAIAELYQAAGAFRLFMLLIHEQPIAFELLLVHDSTAYLLKRGYDERFRSLSPGNVSLALTLQHSCQEGGKISTVDILPPNTGYKHWWASRSRVLHRVLLYSRTPRSRLIHLGRSIGKMLRTAMRRRFDRH